MAAAEHSMFCVHTVRAVGKKKGGGYTREEKYESNHGVKRRRKESGRRCRGSSYRLAQLCFS